MESGEYPTVELTRLLRSSLSTMTSTLAEHLIEYDMDKMHAGIAAVFLVSWGEEKGLVL